MNKLFITAVFLSATVYAGVLRDSRDGQTYRTVVIAGQNWMAQNLNYKTSNSWCFGDYSGYCQNYGRLYTWNAAMNACPAGWRLPSNVDFENLKAAAEARTGVNNAGDALRDPSFGFNIQFAGNRSGGAYKLLDETVYLWSSDDDDYAHAYDWTLSAVGYNFTQGNIKYGLKQNGFSVRCVENRGGSSMPNLSSSLLKGLLKEVNKRNTDDFAERYDCAPECNYGQEEFERVIKSVGKGYCNDEFDDDASMLVGRTCKYDVNIDGIPHVIFADYSIWELYAQISSFSWKRK